MRTVNLPKRHSLPSVYLIREWNIYKTHGADANPHLSQQLGEERRHSICFRGPWGPLA